MKIMLGILTIAMLFISCNDSDDSDSDTFYRDYDIYEIRTNGFTNSGGAGEVSIEPDALKITLYGHYDPWLMDYTIFDVWPDYISCDGKYFDYWIYGDTLELEYVDNQGRTINLFCR